MHAHVLFFPAYFLFGIVLGATSASLPSFEPVTFVTPAYAAETLAAEQNTRHL